jgi:hypothetical protein
MRKKHSVGTKSGELILELCGNKIISINWKTKVDEWTFGPQAELTLWKMLISRCSDPWLKSSWASAMSSPVSKNGEAN